MRRGPSETGAQSEQKPVTGDYVRYDRWVVN